MESELNRNYPSGYKTCRPYHLIGYIILLSNISILQLSPLAWWNMLLTSKQFTHHNYWDSYYIIMMSWSITSDSQGGTGLNNITTDQVTIVLQEGGLLGL